jgi:hypothetical protein
MASIPIYIPTYISDQTYNPCRVQPRLLFFNGMLNCEPYYIESGSTTTGGTAFEQTAFPYFDNYNVVSGSFPTSDSDSLLFYNEVGVYGEIPTNTLYSDYWSKYVELIYNPRTRVLNASTIIPLADYFKMELNDIVELRGNYYHLRAINDYNLKNGECSVQLLGPILSDAVPLTPPPPTTSTSTTTTTAVVNPCRCYEVVFGASGGEINYNNCAGATFNYVSMGASTYYQCVQVIGGLAQIFVVSGDVTLNIVGNCLTQSCPPSTTTTTAGTTTTTAATTTTTAATTTTTAATTTTTTLAPTATLSWSFTESIGSSGYMDIYVNGSVVESRSNTSSGTYNVEFGDTINVQVACFTCGSPNTYANAYSFSNRLILADAACVNNGEASILTANYTVVSGDLGGTITLDTFARCDSGCI